MPQAQRGPSPHGQRAHRVPGHGTTADRGAQLRPEHGRAFPLPLCFALQIFWTGSRMPRERSRPHGSGCLLGSTGPSSPGEGWHGHPAPHAAPLPRHFHRARFSFPSLSPSIGIIGSASSQVMTGSEILQADTMQPHHFPGSRSCPALPATAAGSSAQGSLPAARSCERAQPRGHGHRRPALPGCCLPGSGSSAGGRRGRRVSQLLVRGLFWIGARPAGRAGHGEHLLPRALTHLSPQAEAAVAKWDGGPH